MKKLLLFIFFFFVTAGYLAAQCVPVNTSTFGLPTVACPDEPLGFVNPHSGTGFTYDWDFCAEDMQTTPSVSVALSSIVGASIPVHTTIVEDNGLYYLFVLSRNNSKLYRLDLGNNPKNSPNTLTDLGTIAGGSFPEPIAIVKEGNMWYGFTCNVVNNNNFIKITFGTSITNPPSYSFWGNISSVIANTRAFDIFKEGSNYYLAAVGTTNNKLAIFDLGANLSGNLNASNLVREDTFSNINTPLCLRAIKDCNNWNIVVASSNNRNFVFTFNNGINNAPIDNVHFLPVGFNSNFAMDTIEENGNFYVLNFDLSGSAHIFNFGDSFLNTPAANYLNIITSNPSFVQMYGISGVKHAQGVSFFSVNIFNSQIFRTDFERNCGASPNTSMLTNPTNITYRNTGNHPVVLNVKDTNGDIVQRYTGNANINSTTTVGNFSAQNVCLGNPLTFNNTSVGADSQVASWLWDFGDSNTSNLKNPTHTYTAAGTYNVSLTVNNLNGCSNTITKQVVVSAGVQADFQEVTTACVGQSITFQNLSTSTNLPFDEANGFYWDFGDGTYSPFQNPTKTYNTAGTYTITLTVQDEAGCTDVISKNINILPNPAVSFNFPSVICAGTPVQFTSVASNATEFLWFFEGHGTSTEANPTVTFAQGGLYDVTLQVKNQNNCIATFTVENIQVLAVPNVFFTTQRVAGSPLGIRFENFSSGANQFIWDFGDGGNANTVSPTYTYSSPGEYIVRLTAISENNCTAVFEQIVSVGTTRADLAIRETRLEDNKIFIIVENKGNTVFNDIQISVQIADTSFLETYTPIILPNQEREIILNTRLPEDLVKKAAFFCVKALPKSSVEDKDPSNNEACRSIANTFVVFEPYPNPAQRLINLSFSAPNEGILELHIQDILGKTISQSFVVSKGFNKEVLNIENLAKGLYIFTFDFGKKVVHKKVIVSN